MKDSLGVLVVVAAIGWVVLAYNGVIYTTGSEWYKACWAKKQAHIDLLKEPVAPDPDLDVLWRNCERSAQKALYDQGMVFAGLPKDNADKRGLAMDAACPSNWRDAPLGGFYMLAIDIVQQGGGPSFIDGFLPADVLLGRAFRSRWPTCASVRMQQGYPKIVERSPGVFEWSEPCEVCEVKSN